MSEAIKQNISTIGEPVTNQAPAPSTEQSNGSNSQRQEAYVRVSSVAAADNPGTLTAASLPSGYLANGSMLDDDGVILPEYLDACPEKLAEALKPLSANSFQRAFLSKVRAASKKKVPCSAKKNCALGMVIQAKKLIHRTKDPAPAVLLDMMQAATATVMDTATFEALYMHLDAICTFMLCE